MGGITANSPRPEGVALVLPRGSLIQSFSGVMESCKEAQDEIRRQAIENNAEINQRRTLQGQLYEPPAGEA